MATATKNAGAKATEYYNQKVAVFVPRQSEEEREITVSVNGNNMIVPTNKQVMIPRKFALVLENMIDQREAAICEGEKYVN